MPYNPNPAAVQLRIAEVSYTFDYDRARPGQWFYGVLNTATGEIHLVAGDVHDDDRNKEQQNERMLNTYASKPAVPAGGWASLNRPGREKERGQGITSSPTGHQAVAKLANIQDRAACLGFRVVKINGKFAMFSDRSNSMNADKTDQRIVNVVQGPHGWNSSTTARMPVQWRDAAVAHLKQNLSIEHVAVDN